MSFFSQLVARLGGRTRLAAIAAGILMGLQTAGVLHLSPEQLQLVLSLLGVGVAFGLRGAIDSLKK